MTEAQFLVEAMTEDLISVMTGEDPAAFAVEYEIVLPEAVREHLDATTRLRAEAARAHTAAAAEARAAAVAGSTNSETGGMEYKVLTQRDSRWSGKFSPENLERTLNSYAAEGWRVVSSFTAASVWKSGSAQIMVILERDTSAR